MNDSKIITTATHESQIDRDRRAELTLLTKCKNLQGGELYDFLNSFGVPIDEYNYLKEKYARVLARYDEEKLNV